MRAYYNELDPKMAAWLRELIGRGLLPDGDVDERDVRDVEPRDLEGYGQVHLFAGIGGWAYGLRLAGWPDERPVWTGSCPCQPFSVAGAGGGVDDARHLWPAFRWIVAQRRPATVFGEQVASKAGRGWLAGVRLDLEAMGYVVGAADLCASCVGEKVFHLEAEYLRWIVDSGDCRVRGREDEIRAFADHLDRIIAGPPHIRQRLFWVADAEDANGRGRERGTEEGTRARELGRGQPSGGCQNGRLADAEDGGLGINRSAQGDGGHADERGEVGGLRDAGGQRRGEARRPRGERKNGPSGHSQAGGLDHADSPGRAQLRVAIAETARHAGAERPGGWSNFSLVAFPNGIARRIEPGLEPLVDGVPARVGRLRGYGNAIVPQVAAEFVRAFMEARR